ncbi:MAG: adenosylcobalamin-dependent ribonucleoside-diphosphate reductase [Bacteroidota bacterium]
MTTTQNSDNSVEKKAYNNEETLATATEYFHGDTLAASVWMNKYALKDSYGNVYELTPNDMHRRLAKEFARIEAKYPNPLSEEKIYNLLKDFKYIVPQGSPMTGIGNDFQIASLSNCFVIGNNGSSDSYGGIMKVDEEQVQLMKRRGGVGHDLSHIRPTGSPVKNSALTSTGIVPFMERYSNSTREVAQDGRRGALMLSISVKHPDAERFIDAKMTQGKVTGANVSVRIDDDFMRCLIQNKPYRQQYPIESENPTYTKEIDAKKLWDKLIHNAWSSAEPGILFWDTIIRESVPDSYADLGFKTVSTNPCGEIPLCPYDSCRLIAINLYSYVENPFTPEAFFNYNLYNEHVQYGQRLMDDLIDLEMEKIDGILQKIDTDPETEDVKHVERELWGKIKTKTLQGRRTGLGITAEGDMLAALNLQYGSDEAISVSVKAQKQLAISAYTSSVAMARERGAFPVYSSEKEKNNPFILRIKEAAPELYSEMIKFGRRNIALLTIAPTGSVSICTQTTSGIEPVFMVSYKRRKKVNPNDKNVKVNFVDEIGDSWEEFNVFHPKFLKWLKVNNYNVDEVKLMGDVELNSIIEKSPYYKATSNDIDWVKKVTMQGAVQKWVDHSISVTVNLPANVNEELVSNIYKTAWESGCKGMTIYRDGSRSGVLISNDKKEDKTKIIETQAPTRPKKLEADVVRFQNNNEKWVAFVGNIDGRPYEIFTGKAEDIFIPSYLTKGFILKNKEQGKETRYDFHYNDKDGYPQVYSGLSRTFSKEFWNYAKLISGILRHGMPISDVVDIIQNMNLDTDNINTWKNGVVRALKKFIPDGTKAKGAKCPECGSEKGLIYKEGCLACTDCGYSKCG